MIKLVDLLASSPPPAGGSGLAWATPRAEWVARHPGRLAHEVEMEHMVRVRDVLFAPGGAFAADAEKIPERVLYDYAGWLFRSYDEDGKTTVVEYYDRSKRKWLEVGRCSPSGLAACRLKAVLRVWPGAEGLLPERIGGVHYGAGMLYPPKRK